MALALIAAATEPSSRALRVGDALPPLQAETLAGTPATLPQLAPGKAAIVVFSFSRDAGRPAAEWGRAIQERLGKRADVELWRVLVLEGVPRLLRGFVTGSIKREIPQSMHGRTLKLFRDAEAWKQRLGVQSVEQPCVVLLDDGGRVRWLVSSVKSDALLAGLQAGVDELIAQPER